MKIFAACFLIFLSNSWLMGQEHPAVTSQPNTIFVGADGKFEAPPDTAVLQFSISAQEDTSRAAFDHASKDAEQVRQILRSNGIEPKTAGIGFFALDPVYDYKNAKRKLIAYRVNATVTLKLKDFTKLASILQQLADSDITDNQSVNYTLESIDAAKGKAVDDAYRRAHDSADVIAHASGRTLGELSYASVDTFENIRPIRPMMQALPRMNAQAYTPALTEEFAAQNITVTAHVNAMFTLK